MEPVKSCGTFFIAVVSIDNKRTITRGKTTAIPVIVKSRSTSQTLTICSTRASRTGCMARLTDQSIPKVVFQAWKCAIIINNWLSVAI